MAKPPSARGVRHSRSRGSVYLVPTAPEAVERGTPPHHTAGALAFERNVEPADLAAPVRVVVLVEREADIARVMERALAQEGDLTPGALGGAQPVALLELPGERLRMWGVDDAAGEARLPVDERSQIIYVTSATSVELGAAGATAGVIIRTPCVVADLVALVREAVVDPA